MVVVAVLERKEDKKPSIKRKGCYNLREQNLEECKKGE